jgi:AraC-like DNA-binding protein/quercetin dioxygenase-like cupin family protein
MEVNDILNSIIKSQRQLTRTDTGAGNEFKTFEEEWRLYPDGSRSFDNTFSLICMVTSNGKKLIHGFGSLPANRLTFRECYFNDGGFSEFHRHNYFELEYVAEGRLYQHISGQDVTFEKGEFCLIDRESVHAEQLYQKPSSLIFLCINSSFFDETIGARGNDPSIAGFLTNIIKGKEPLQYIRFKPKKNKTEAEDVVRQIILETVSLRPGSARLIMGYIERILSLLPEEYEIIIKKNNRREKERMIFNEIHLFLHQHYQTVTIRELCAAFNRNADYFNRIIKKHTGLRYSAFLQDIRLEKAKHLLSTTSYKVEKIASLIGYENIGYF